MKEAITIQALDLNVSTVNGAAIELVKNTLIPGGISYFYDRHTDYRAYAKTQGHRFELYGAMNEKGELLGITQITFDKVFWEGAPIEVSYSGDTRVSLKARGKKIADRLIETSCRQTVPVLGAVLGDNDLVLTKKLEDWKRLGVNFKIIGELQTLFCKARKFKTSKESLSAKGIEIGEASEADLPEMEALWKKEKAHQNLARAYSGAGDFKNSYFQTEGVSLRNTRVLKKDGKIAGFISIWNQDSIRKIEICKLSTGMQIGRMLVKPFISIPKAGESLKVVYAFQHCFDSGVIQKDPELARLLIRETQGHAFTEGAVLFSLGLDSADPLFPILKPCSMAVKIAKIIGHDSSGRLIAKPGSYFHLEVGMG